MENGQQAPGLSGAAIAVVVVNWNAGRLLRQCLDGVFRQTRQARQVVLVDNASTDGSADDLEADYPDLRVLRLQTNTGFAAANNRAIEAIEDCRWIALLNPDAVPAPDWLERLDAAARGNPEFSFFGSLLRMADQSDRLDGAGDNYHVSGLAWRRCHGRRVPRSELASKEVFSPCAAAAMFRADLLREVGGFEESYFCYFEDVDLAFRLRLRGHRCLFVADSVVEHVGSGTTGSNSDFTVYHGHRNLVWTWIRNMPLALLLVYLPQHLLLNFITVLWYTLQGRAGMILRCKRDALRGIPAALVARRRIQAARSADLRSLYRVMSRGVTVLRRGCHGH